jgi:hypothetical protein
MSFLSFSAKIALAIFALLLARPALATSVSFTDATRWSLSSKNVRSVDFSSADWPDSGQFLGLSQRRKVSLFVIDPWNFEIVLRGAFTAVALNLFSESPTGVQLNIRVNGDDNYTDNTAFWGMVSTEPIQILFVNVAAPDANYVLSGDLSFGKARRNAIQSEDTPEAATFVLAGAGLLALALRRLSARWI